MPGLKTGFEGGKIMKKTGKDLKSNVICVVFMLIKSDFHKFSKEITQDNAGMFIKMAQMEIKLN